MSGVGRALQARVRACYRVRHVHTSLSSLMNEEQAERLQMQVSPDFLQPADAPRGRQLVPPLRAESIRRPVRHGLGASEPVTGKPRRAGKKGRPS